MPDLKPELAKLYSEQIAFQFNPKNPTERTRTLGDYALEFDAERDPSWLTNEIQSLVRGNERSLMVDLGCGNTSALREAKMEASQSGVEFRTIGVDIIPPDLDKLEFFVTRLPHIFDPRILFPENAPEFIQDDIDEVKFPESADIVTLCSVLFWTRDPLKALANAAVQTKVGGLICADGLGRVKEATTYRSMLQRRVYASERSFSSFKLENRLYPFPDSLVLRKIKEMNDPEEVLEDLFGFVPKIEERYLTQRAGGFYYTYCS